MADDYKIREIMCRLHNQPTELNWGPQTIKTGSPPLQSRPPDVFRDSATVYQRNPFLEIGDPGPTRVATLASEAPTLPGVRFERSARAQADTQPMRPAHPDPSTAVTEPRIEPVTQKIAVPAAAAEEAEVTATRVLANEAKGVAGGGGRLIGATGAVVGIAFTVTQNTPAETKATVVDPIDPHYLDSADRETEYFVRLAGYHLGLVKEKPTPPWRHDPAK